MGVMNVGCYERVCYECGRTVARQSSLGGFTFVQGGLTLKI